MNILKTLPLTDEKPAVLQLKNTGRSNILGIGLKKGQVLKKHLSPIPAFLVVLKGTLDFDLNGATTRLFEFDTFEIPVNELHEVTAVNESVFMVIKEKNEQ